MNKAELIERIIDAITDPWNECPFDFEDLAPLNLEEATGYLADLRHDEDLSDLDPEDRLPAAVTPELYMEAFNCYLRKMRHECHILRLSKYLTDNECVCEYDQFRDDYKHNDPMVLPVDFLLDGFPFPTASGEDPDMLDMLLIGKNSARTFNPEHDYCWYDKRTTTLFSSDTPFHDGIIHARALAEFILGPDGHTSLNYFLSSLLDDDKIEEIFHCSEAEVRELYSLS